MDNDKKSGDDDAAPFSGAATTGTAAPSPAGAHDEEAQSRAAATAAAAAAATAPRGACTPSPAAFWIFAVLGWLDFLVVVIFVTPKNHWLRQDGDKVDWFGVGGGSHVVTDSCDAGILSDDWCNKFQTFQILQVVATASIAAAALVLLVAVCRSYPRRWGIASSVFFFLYAVMQGVVVWLVVHLWREVEDVSEEVATETALFTTFPVDLDYGTTTAIAFYAGVAGFNEGLLLLAFAKYSSKNGRSLKDNIPVPTPKPASAPTHPRAASSSDV